MTLIGGTGYALIALGPAISLFVSCIAAKPFLILTLLFSTLSWLVTLILIAGFWRAFLPGGSASWVYVPILLSAVAFQEFVRVLFWRLYVKVENVLNKLAVKLSKPRVHAVDKIEIALAFGLGHGLAHAIFFCVSLLTPAFGPATFYIDACPQMPLFLVAALTALGFLLVHTCSMIIAFNGHEEGKTRQQMFVPCMHLLAALLTLVNLAPGGCVFGVSLTLSSAAVTSVVCWKVLWDKTGPDSMLSGSMHRTQHVTLGF
jgi:anterior pharynx defective protein 1